MGVRRAVEMALDAPNNYEGPIYTLGPLIHNPQVLTVLEEKGISTMKDIPAQGSGTVLIRAHGVPPEIKKNLVKAGFNIVDATCPRVLKVQTIIRKYSRQGYTSIIVGDKDHSEVVGLLGHAGKNGYIASSLDELKNLPPFDRAIIVAQTTQNVLFFEQVKTWAKTHFPHYEVFNTVCDSTEKRQADVKRLANLVDVVLVVGGRNSANTQRLVEVANRCGKPAYHIEGETELDAGMLVAAKCIGITAGASTPNWTIKRVYRALEALLLRKDQSWREILFKIQRALLLSNVYLSIGAGCLCYACIGLQGIEFSLPNLLVSTLYVQSMHIFNHLTARKADRYNDPDKASFYLKHKDSLALLSIITGAAGLSIAYFMGMIPFLLLLSMIATGLSYNFELLPTHFFKTKYRRIRDIPASKTILIAAAWGILTSVLPAISVPGKIGLGTALVFFWSASMVFVRTSFFDILDMQGDRIVGKETIPTLLGEKKTTRLLKFVMGISFFLLCLSAVSHIFPNLGFALAICPIFLFMILSFHERGDMPPGIRLEFLVETQFVLAGIITFVYSLA